MEFYAILLLQKPLRILHQIINFEIKKFFSNLNSYYAPIKDFADEDYFWLNLIAQP